MSKQSREAEYIDIDQPEEKTAREMALEIEIADLRRDNELLRSRIADSERREAERDRELRSVMLSFIAWVEKTHGWESREEKREKRRNGGRGGPAPAPLSAWQE